MGAGDQPGLYAQLEKETTRTTEYTLTFETSQDEDAVAFFSIPTENYVYYIYTYNSEGGFTRESSVISNTFTPCYQVLSLEYYESIQGNYENLPQIQGAAITSTPGDPGSYPSSAGGYNVIAQWDEYPAGVSFGNGSITQEIEITTEESESYQLGGYWNFKFGGGGQVQSDLLQSEVDITGGIEFSLNPSNGWSTINLEGTTFSGTVANMPVEFQDYGYYYSWKLFAYSYEFGNGMSVPVVSYLVGDVSKPPALPGDFQQDFEKSTSDSNHLTWSYGGAATKFHIYKYNYFPVGGGLDKVATIDVATTGNYTTKYDGEGKSYREYFYKDENLAPYTEYQYAIQVERLSPVPPLSAPSALLSARTKAQDGYPKLSIAESDGSNDASLLIYPDKVSTLTVNITGPDGQNAASYYSIVQYQWQKMDKGAWKNLVNETYKTLTFSNAGVDSAGLYRCLVNVQTKSNGTNISAFTHGVEASHAKRSSYISEAGVTDISGGIRLYAKVKNAHSSDSTSVPSGIVSFTLTSGNTGEEYQRHVYLNGSGVAEDIVEGGLPKGVYTVDVYYSGSFIFKACSAETMYLSEISSGYSIDSPLGIVYGNGAEVYFQKVNKTAGVTATAREHAGSAELFRGDAVAEGRQSSAKLLSPDSDRTYSVTAGTQYYFFDEDGIVHSFLATHGGAAVYKDGYILYGPDTNGDPVSVESVLNADNTTPGRYTIAKETPAGSYVIKMQSNGTPSTVVHAPITVARRAIALRLPTSQAGESSDASMTDPTLGALEVVGGSWAAGGLTLPDESVSVSYINTAGQAFDNENVLEMCGYYTVYRASPDTVLAPNYSISFLDGALTVIGATKELSAAAREFNGLDVGTVYAISPQYGYTRGVLAAGALKQNHAVGTRVVLTAVPDIGYQVYDWYINGVAQNKSANSLAHVMLNEDTEIEVAFDIKKNTLKFGTAGDESGGTIICSDGTITSGSVLLAKASLKFTAVAKEGYHFKEWRYTEQDSGAVYDAEDEGKMTSFFDFVMPNSSCTVHAVFERDFYTLTFEDGNGNDGLTAWYYDTQEDGKTATSDKVYIKSGARVKGDTYVTVEPAKGCRFDKNRLYTSTGSQGEGDYDKGTYAFSITKDTHVKGYTTREDFDLTLSFVVTTTEIAPDACIIYTVDGVEKTFKFAEGSASLTVEKIPGGSPVSVQADFPSYYSLGGWVHEGVSTFAAGTEINRLATLLPSSGSVTKGAAYFYAEGGTTFYFTAPESGRVVCDGAEVTLYILSGQYAIPELDGDAELTLYLAEKATYTVALEDITGDGEYSYELPEGAVEDPAKREIAVHSGDTFTVTVIPKTGVTVAQWAATQGGTTYTSLASSLSFQFNNIQSNYALKPVFVATTYNTVSWPSISQEANGITLINESVPSVTSGKDFTFALVGAGVRLIDKVFANGNEFTPGGNTAGGTGYKYESGKYTISNIRENQVISVTLKDIGITVGGTDISEFSGTGWTYAPATQELKLTRSNLTISGEAVEQLAEGLYVSFGESAGSVIFDNLTLKTDAATALNNLKSDGLNITLTGKNTVAVSNETAANICAIDSKGDVTFRGNGSLAISAKAASSTANVYTLRLLSKRLTVTGNVNMSVSSESSKISNGINASELVVGAESSTAAPTLRVTSTGVASTAITVNSVKVYGGSLLANGDRYGLRAYTIDNYDGVMELSGNEGAFEKIHVFDGYTWTAYYEKGFQLRTKEKNKTDYETESTTGYEKPFVLTASWEALIKAILGLGSDAKTYDYVLMSALESVSGADIPLTVKTGSGVLYTGDLEVVSGQDSFYYLEENTIKRTTNRYMTIEIESGAEDSAYIDALEALQAAAIEREAHEYIAKYDSARNTLILGSFAYDAGYLKNIGRLTELNPDDGDILTAFKDLFVQVVSFYYYTPDTDGTAAEVTENPSKYDFTLSGTISDVSETAAAPAVDASSAAVKSLTLKGYASTGLTVGSAPLYIDGTNYLTSATSPLTAAGELNICGTTEPGAEKDYPKQIDDTLTLTRNASGGSAPVIQNSGAGGLQINLTNVKALTAYGQTGDRAVSTDYTVTYRDDLLSEEVGVYGFAWLQDLGSTAANAVTRSEFEGTGGDSYLKLYAATSDAGASVPAFVYDKSAAGQSENVLSAKIFAPAVLGLIHKFYPAEENGTSYAELQGKLELGADYTWENGTFALLTEENSALSELARGSYTVKLYFYDEDTSDADFYTLSIPLTVKETEVSKGGLSISPEEATTRRGLTVSLQTAFTGTTPTAYVWEISRATDSTTELIKDGAKAALKIGAGEQGKITVTVSSYEGSDTGGSPLGTASAVITVAPTAMSMTISCDNETPSGDESYTLYHNTADGSAKAWQFNAKVSLDDGGESGDVAWSLWGATYSKTAVDADGKLTIHPSETGSGGRLELTATYTHGDKSTFAKTIGIYLSTDAFVSYEAGGAKGSVTSAKYGVSQTEIPAAGKWIPKNNRVTVTAAPDEGYIVKTWYVNGASVMDNAAYAVDGESHTLGFTAAAMTHYKITADYINASSHTVTYSALGDNGSVSAVYNGAAFRSGGTVTKGDGILFTARPNGNCVVSLWLVNGEVYREGGAVYAGTELELLGIGEDMTVSVGFEGKPLEVKAIASQEGGGAPRGAVTMYVNGALAEPAQNDEADNSVSYTAGARALDNVLIFASPEPGQQVKTWKVKRGENYVAVPGSGEMLTYSVGAIDGDLDVQVVFEPVTEYNLTVYSNSYENGEGTVVYGRETVRPGNRQEFKVLRHSTATLVAVPGPGSYLYDWTVEGTADYTEDGNTLILEGVTQDVVVKARFRTNYYSVALSAVGAGDIQAAHSHEVDSSSNGTIAASGEVKGGSKVVITAAPSGESMLTSLRINGAEVSPALNTAGETSYSFVIAGLSEDISVEAVFESFARHSVTAPGDYTPGGGVSIAPADDGFSTDFDPADRTVEIASGSSACMTFTPEAGYALDSAALRAELEKVLDGAVSQAGFAISLSSGGYVVTIAGVDTALDFSGMENPFVSPEEPVTYRKVTLDDAENGTLAAFYNGMGVLSGAMLPKNAELVVAAIPDGHYRAESLSANSLPMEKDAIIPGGLPGSAYVSTSVLTADTTYSAQFVVSEHKVTIAVLGTGSGEVTVTDGAAALSATGYMPAASELTVTAAAAEGSALSYLVVGGSEIPEGGETAVTLESDLTVYAVFEAVSRAVTYNAPDNGMLKVFTATGGAPESGDVLPVGTMLAVIAMPDANYQVKSLTGGGTAIVGNAYRVDAAKQNSIICLFERYEMKVTWDNPAGGTVTVTYGDGPDNGAAISSGEFVPAGSKIRIAAAASGNYQLETLTFNGQSIGSNTQHAVNSDSQIIATFKYVGDVPPAPTPGPGPGGGPTVIVTPPKSDSKYSLNVTVVGNGSVDVSVDGKKIESGSGIELGTVLNVAAAPRNGTNLLSLKINGVEVESGVKYEVYANADIVAVFDVTIPYYLNAANERVFIGLSYDVDRDGAWDEKDYIAPAGTKVQFATNTKTFTDISGHWSEEFVDFVAGREIFVGVEGTKFAPNTNISRAMFVAVIGRLYERSYGEITAAGNDAFTDCSYTAYYGKYVDWAAEKGIIKGYGNGLFGPDDQITREQMAVIMLNFAKLIGKLPEKTDGAIRFRDAVEISGWAAEGVLFCQTTGILQGIGDGLFAPSAKATRAEGAAVVTSFIRYILTGSEG